MRYLRENEIIREQQEVLKKKLKFPYVLKVTNTRMYLDSEIGNYMTQNDKIPIRELGYIDKIKQDIIKNKRYELVPKIKKDSINFFTYSKEIHQGKEIKNCYEIDLNRAYWNMAYTLGILTPKFYKLAYDINPKTGKVFMGREVRLATIGSLARHRRIYSFDGRKEHVTYESSPETEHVWDYVCYKISKIMEEARKAVGDDFVFYWVDAILVKSLSARKKVLQVFKKHGYGHTDILIDSVKLIPEIKKVGVVTNKKDLHKKDGRVVRTFPHGVENKKEGRHAAFFRMRDGKKK